jgi:prevent-host-death family protein
MVHRVSVDEAQDQLAQLIDAAVEGDVVLISKNGDQIVQLIPVAASASASPQFGSGAGLMVMADDFDEPLADFAEYMP